MRKSYEENRPFIEERERKENVKIARRIRKMISTMPGYREAMPEQTEEEQNVNVSQLEKRFRNPVYINLDKRRFEGSRSIEYFKIDNTSKIDELKSKGMIIADFFDWDGDKIEDLVYYGEEGNEMVKLGKKDGSFFSGLEAEHLWILKRKK